MSWSRPMLLLIIVALLVLIGIRYQENGGFTGPLQARVNKLERGNREAVRRLESELDPRSIDGWVDLGQVYTAFALMPEAEYCFQRAAKLGNLSLEQRFKYGICLSRRGKMEKSISVLLPVGNSNNELAVHANLQIGLDYLRLDKPQEAKVALRKARIDPMAELALARILLREDGAEDAIVVLDSLIQRNPASMRAHQMRSWAYESLGDKREARRAYDHSLHTSEMLIIYPLSRDWDEETVGQMGAAKHMTASSLALQLNDYQRAISEGELALELIEPLWRPGYGIQMARCHLADNNPTEALAYLAKWLVHDGESAQLWEMTGDAFLAFGDEDAAEAAWLRGTKIRASKSVEANAEICRKLVLLYDKQGNQQQARIYRGWHQYEAGRLQWRDNNVRQGIVLLRQASEILPEQEQVWFYLAESYRALSDRTSARATYQKCLAINKNHGRALTGLALSQ